jgi:hypothetical protein
VFFLSHRGLLGRALSRGALAALKVRRRRRKESAVKPGSVVDSHSSGIRVAAQLKRPTRKPVCGPHTAAKGAACLPIWSCSRWGLPCRWCCHPRGALLPHHFTLTGSACAALRRYLSVALSVGSRLPGVTWHLALWSPDFPPCAYAHSDCLADSWGAPYADMAAIARWSVLSAAEHAYKPRCRARR